MLIHCLPNFPHHPFPWVSEAPASWKTATAAVFITTVVGPGIADGEQPLPAKKKTARDAWNQSRASLEPCN